MSFSGILGWIVRVNTLPPKILKIFGRKKNSSVKSAQTEDSAWAGEAKKWSTAQTKDRAWAVEAKKGAYSPNEEKCWAYLSK